MTKSEATRSPFEENIIKVLKSIDNQIAREMQRTPAQRDAHGVQKWEPFQKRIEIIVATILNGIGDQELTIDGVLVFSQAMSKALLLLIEDLGEQGLGKIRGEYCNVALDAMMSDIVRAKAEFKDQSEAN